MIFDGISRGGRITPPYGVKDAAMLFQRLRDAARNIPKNASREQVPGLLYEIDKDRVSRSPIERVAEFVIGARGGRDVAGALGLTHMPQQLRHPLDGGVGYSRRPEPCRFRLEQR